MQVVNGGREVRLSDVLFDSVGRSFGSFAALPSNVEAVESCLRFTAGDETFVLLVGPSGWGKSHLLTAVAARLGGLGGPPCERTPALEAALAPAASDPVGPLLLDDLEEVFTRSRCRVNLQVLLERRVRMGRPTMLAATMPRPSRAVRALLPGRGWRVETVEAPLVSERNLLVRHLASAEGVALSPRLVEIIAREMHGDARTLLGAINRLRLSGEAWRDDRAALRALGILDCFFSDNPGWDLRERVVTFVETNRHLFPRASTRELAAYILLREARLNELDVARTLGFEPAEAFVKATRYESRRTHDPALDRYVETVADLVLTDLLAEG